MPFILDDLAMLAGAGLLPELIGGAAPLAATAGAGLGAGAAGGAAAAGAATAAGLSEAATPLTASLLGGAGHVAPELAAAMPGMYGMTPTGLPLMSMQGTGGISFPAILKAMQLAGKGMDMMGGDKNARIGVPPDGGGRYRPMQPRPQRRDYVPPVSRLGLSSLLGQRGF